jgi:hypothetical protein
MMERAEMLGLDFKDQKRYQYLASLNGLVIPSEDWSGGLLTSKNI